MKILLNIFFILFYSLAFGQNIFVDLRKNVIELDTAKTNIIICISTNSCHDCYQEFNDFLSSVGLYVEKDINIVILSFWDSISLGDISNRKLFYNTSKFNFPYVKQKLFTKKTKGNACFLVIKWRKDYFHICTEKGEEIKFLITKILC